MKRATKVILLMLVALSPHMASAMYTVAPYSSSQGQLVYQSIDKPGEYLKAPTLNSDVNIHITGIVARVKVTQTFTNPTSEWLNGLYVFPLPELAAVDHLQMRIGQRLIEGQIQVKEKARQIFAQAKKAGKKASLVEQRQGNLFTNQLANIGPGETVVVSIEYQQSVDYDQGQFSIRFPMVAAPRYTPPSDGNRVQSVPVEIALKPDDSQDPHQVSLSVMLQSGMALSHVRSDFHPIRVNELNSEQYQVTLESNQVLANRDFVLRWRPNNIDSVQAALFTQDVDDERYALLMVIPPLAALTPDQVLAKEVIFVIDTSGSMYGESIAQAKQALLQGLDMLGDDDKFNVIEFNSDASALFASAMTASTENIAYAKNQISRLQAEGGTNIELALDKSLTPVSEDGLLRQVVFITDGGVSNEEALFGKIRNTLGESRLFTVGIGSAPNSRFMRGAATLGRGTFTYIGAPNQVGEQMSALFRKLQNPVLRDVTIRAGDDSSLSHLDFWPNPVRDLYLGEPLMVSLKLPQNTQNLSVQGQLAGSDWYLDLPVDSNNKAKGLDVLWARNKIRSLNDAALNPILRKQLESQIAELGMQYHLVTRFTSLVAVDVTPTRPEGQANYDKTIANHRPAGMPHGQLPQGATSAQLQLLSGLLLLVLCLMMRCYCTKDSV